MICRIGYNNLYFNIIKLFSNKYIYIVYNVTRQYSILININSNIMLTYIKKKTPQLTSSSMLVRI